MLSTFRAIEEELRAMAFKSGASIFVAVDPKNVVTARWVRLKCQYGCVNYGTSLSCPPYSPAPDETRKVLDEYMKAYLVGFDGLPDPAKPGIEGWIERCTRVRETLLALERHAFSSGYPKALSYDIGTCRKCEKCAIAEGRATCRFPGEMRPSMEAAGIDVYATVQNAGLKISVVKDKTVTNKDELHLYTLLLLD